MSQGSAGLTGQAELSRAEHAVIVLDAARTELQRGWSQHGWHVTQDAAGGHRAVTGQQFGFTRLDRTQVVSSCLVGAVLQAGWWYSDRSEDSAPAIDALWNGLQVLTGQGAPTPIERVCSPVVRTGRVRELTRWNDQPGRSRDDVLLLLDLSRSLLAQAGTAAA